MLNKEELSIIKESLPYNGTKLIKRKLHRVSNESISTALNHPATSPELYRKDIIDAALDVIREHRNHLTNQRTQILELTTL